MAQAPVPSPVGTPAFACVAEAWTAHEAELRGFLRHQTGDADAAEDLLQDTFLKAIGAGAQFCGLDDPRAWLFRVARNALIDRLRLARPQDPIDKHAETLAAAVPEPLMVPATVTIVAFDQLEATALALHPGSTLLDTDLDEEYGKYVYEVELRDTNGIEWDVELNALTGQVLKNHQDT